MLLRLLSFLGSWSAPRRKAPPRRPIGTMLEPLEQRIAPAAFVSTHIVTYTDIDGDKVTIHSSHPIFANAAGANTILKFSTGTVDGTSTPQQLQLIDLTGVSSKLAAGDNISVTVQKVSGGDGLANVGFIDSDVALGHVSVQGDLGRINAGLFGVGGAHYVGLTSLSVDSLGAHQAAGGSLASNINGAIGSITVQKDMVNAEISVTPNTGGNTNNGNIGSIKIGGSLIGGADTSSGAIVAQGNVGSITIGGDILGGAGSSSGSLQIEGKIGRLSVKDIIGYTVPGDTTGQGQNSASVITGSGLSVGGIGSLTILGNLTGGDGSGSAFIGESSPGNSPVVTGGFGTVKIGGAITGGTGDYSGDLNATSFGAISIGGSTTGGIIGSSGVNSGSITSSTSITSLAILEGGIIGGTNTESGSVVTTSGSIGSILIHGDITGASAAATGIAGTGQISSGVSIGSINLYGSLHGSTAITSGSILAGANIGHVTLHTLGSTDSGSIIGGAGANSGELTAYSITSISMPGHILGGGAIVSGGTNTGVGSGKILTTSNLGSVTIGQGIIGGNGAGSGVLDVGSGFGARLTSLNITTGGITGGVGANSGQVKVGGTIGSVKLNGAAITGGTGATSGALIASDSIGSVSLGTLLIGSPAGAVPGEISTGGNLTSLTFTGPATGSTTVTGNVDITGSAGSITVHGDVLGTGDSTGEFVIGGGVKSFTITGALRGGSGAPVGAPTDTGLDSGSIFAGQDDIGVIGSLSIAGGIIGGGGAGSGDVFSGGGITKASIGDLIGGKGQSSGSIVSDFALGAITITATGPGVTVSSVTTHGIFGGIGDASGQISAGTTIGSVVVKGTLQGNTGFGSGAILSNSSFTQSGDIQGNIGSISITGADSGQISAAGNIKTLSITGDVTGSGGIVAGANLIGSTGGDITTLKLAGALSSSIEAGHIGSATIASIQAGTAAGNGAIRAANDIASLTVTSAITGTLANPVVISAVGQLTPGKTDLAFGKISVGHDVTFTNFLAGYDQSGNAVNGAASIASVVVGGDWSGSNLVAGVVAGTSGNFGDLTDTLITNSASVIPSIASIIIKGNVITTSTGVAHTYGFVAKTIGAFSVHGVAQSLTAGLIDPVAPSTDTDLQEVHG